MNKWRFLDSGPNTGAVNMAVDEDLLRRAAQGAAPPTLRFYTWDPPAVSLGRFQHIETAVRTAACRRHGIDIVKRVTGGRAVLHHRELTYSVVARTDNALFPPDVLGTYRIIAGALIAGLHALGINAEMVSRSGRHASLVKKGSRDPSCFASPSWYEILVAGKKIIGSAQRRIPGAFLQHGSILLDYDRAMESDIVCGGGSGEAVTTINRELADGVSLAQVKAAFLQGFSAALGVVFV